MGNFQIRQLAAGEKLFSGGEPAEYAYILTSGKLQAVLEAPGQAPRVLGEINPGEFVGEMAFFNHEPRSASVEAVVPSELIEIPLENLDAIVFSKPSWSKALLQTLSKRLKGANEKKAA